MSQWYYVYEGERKGPVEANIVQDLYASGKLNDHDYVWRKGFENWMKISDTNEFNKSTPELSSVPSPPAAEEIPQKITPEPASFEGKDPNHKIFFIKTGADRGGSGAEYGPFSLNVLKKLHSENRINSKTFIFFKGIDNWIPLGEVQGYQNAFNSVPDKIEEKDKRAFKRKPLIARMFIENNNQLFEGICRDVSIGGMQVLVDNFPAKAGERISINVHPENTDHHFAAGGEIVRLLEGGLGFSFRFINLSDEAIKAINSYISGE
jgi:hypothetical protein